MDEEDSLVIRTKVRNKKRYESMLFEYETTPLTDYRFGLLWEPKVKTHYTPKEKASHTASPSKEPLKVTQTMTEWRESKVPFDLFMKPKEIVQTDPRKIQEFHIMPEISEREKARKTRPRIALTPAVNIDDAGDRELKLILEDHYLSTTHREMRAGIAAMASTKPIVAPLVLVPAPPVPIKLKKYVPRVVPPEWRQATLGWDSGQLRACCDPTKEFWLRPR